LADPSSASFCPLARSKVTILACESISSRRQDRRRAAAVPGPAPATPGACPSLWGCAGRSPRQPQSADRLS
jgi:hypothetical protein